MSVQSDKRTRYQQERELRERRKSVREYARYKSDQAPLPDEESPDEVDGKVVPTLAVAEMLLAQKEGKVGDVSTYFERAVAASSKARGKKYRG